MQRIKLQGVDVLQKPVKLSKDVSQFTDDKHRMGVTKLNDKTIQLVTSKGTYKLTKHNTQNYFHGSLNNHKVHVILKKVVGEVLFW